jgi:lysozyme family protein
MANFKQALSHTLKHEGGGRYTNAYNDRGGPTRWGITIKTLTSWRASKQPVTPRDVETLTRQEAESIYFARYWCPMRCAEVDDQRVANKMFDMSVNFGVRRASHIVQVAIRDAHGLPVPIDGVVGPATIGAVNSCLVEPLLDAMCHHQTDAYRSIVERDPTQSRFIVGWLRRASWKGGR